MLKKPKYLLTFTVGYDQRNNINAAVKKVYRKIIAQVFVFKIVLVSMDTEPCFFFLLNSMIVF
jgi:undecaprenyl pyrophosphate synthase